MSVNTNIGREIFATQVYKMALETTFGVRAGGISEFKEYNRYMILKVLEWNDTSQYLTADQIQCLESKIRIPSRNCNC